MGRKYGLPEDDANGDADNMRFLLFYRMARCTGSTARPSLRSVKPTFVGEFALRDELVKYHSLQSGSDVFGGAKNSGSRFGHGWSLIKSYQAVEIGHAVY